MQEFCDPFGETTFTHPAHEEHLQEYLASENVAIEEENAALMESRSRIKDIKLVGMDHGYLM